MKRSLYVLAAALILSTQACKSGNSNGEQAQGEAQEEVQAPNVHDIKDYYAVVAPLISNVEFSALDAVKEVANGTTTAQKQVFTPNYMMVQFGEADETRHLEARAWPMDNGKTMVAVNFMQYEEAPKIKFFEVDNNDMAAQEVESPVNLHLSDDVALLYSLKKQTPNIAIWTYDMETTDGDPMYWTGKWNGKTFDVELTDYLLGESVFGPFTGYYLWVENMKNDSKIFMTLAYDNVSIYVGSCFDVEMSMSGTPEDMKMTDKTLTFEANLTSRYEDNIQCTAKFKVTKLDNGLYQADITAVKNAEALKPFLEKHDFVKLNKFDYFDDVVPANLNTEKVTIVNMLKSISQYFYRPEIVATINHLYSGSELSEDEQVTVDEKNRFLSYAWGSLDQCMECKYWKRSDGKYLFAVNRHDATYEYPQDLRFFVFDYDKNTIQNLPSAPFGTKWGTGQYADGKIYQVRYETDDFVAIVPAAEGGGLEAEMMKFNGETFN